MTISESTSDSFNDRIIRKYLYADENASNYASDQFIGRTSGQTDSIPVEDYMLYGPGRFAQPIFFELIQRFFNLIVDILLGRAQNFTIDQALAQPTSATNGLGLTNQVVTLRADGSYEISKDALIAILVGGANGSLISRSRAFGLEFNQALFDDDADDYFTRVFLWATTAFKIGDEALFVIDPDGARWIEEFNVVPLANEEFDFVSGDFTSLFEIASIPRTDPFGIGRKVTISFEGEITPEIYTQEHYDQDRLSSALNIKSIAGTDFSSGTLGGQLPLERPSFSDLSLGSDDFYTAVAKLGATYQAYFTRLYSQGVIEYRTEDGFDIYYGTEANDRPFSVRPENREIGAVEQGWKLGVPFLEAAAFNDPVTNIPGQGAFSALVTAAKLAAKLLVAPHLNYEMEAHGRSSGSIILAGPGDDFVISGFGQDTLLGGAGDDLLIDPGGLSGITIGGLGRDWIYNASSGGEVWGDIANSQQREDGTNFRIVGGVEVEAPDSFANADTFWFAKDVKIMDAQKSDRLKYYGLPLLGGDTTMTTLSLAATAIGGPVAGLALQAAAGGASLLRAAARQPLVYYDRFVPGVTYMFDGNDLLVGDVSDVFWKLLFGQDLVLPSSVKDMDGVMRVKDFDRGEGTFFGVPGDLAIALDNFDPTALIVALAFRAQGVPIAQSVVAATAAQAMAVSAALMALRYAVFAKGAGWQSVTDPLVIDLDGDGIETLAAGDATVFFDVDGDFFRERTGWLKSDDGFLVLDSNGNGRIDDISEMFGNAFEGGYAELAAFDGNGDGRITVADAVWAELRVWQDFDYDGETDSGELTSLDALGIVELDLASTALDATTPQGAELLSYGDVRFADGTLSTAYEAIFAASETITRYAGESGRPSWQGSTLDARGLGSITDLSVAMANDAGFAELAQGTADAMVATDIRTLVAQAGDVLGQWGATQELTRELYAVRLSADGTQLLERSEWDGGPLAAGWSLEQGWSPVTRGASASLREEAPYLVQVVDPGSGSGTGGRAQVLDYGIRQQGGTWVLASAPGTSYATVADVLASGHAAGTEWRVEEIGFNPLAELPVERIGVRFTDGQVVDYTVEVTDRDGTFLVWARNLDRAIQLEWKTGDSREFVLRNYAVDLETLDEVNSTDDSTYRVEILTPQQFNFATSLGGIDFRPEMLSASLDSATGHIDYAVGPTGSANLSTDPTKYVSGVNAMIGLLPSLPRRRPGVMERRRAAAANDNGLSKEIAA